MNDLVYNEESFKNNDEKVLFFTGLSTWELLNVIFQYVKHQLRQNSTLTPFQQLIITYFNETASWSQWPKTLPIVLGSVVPPLASKCFVLATETSPCMTR